MLPYRRPSAAAPDQAGYFELLRGNADVRWLWAGAVVSLFGDWFNTLALSGTRTSRMG